MLERHHALSTGSTLTARFSRTTDSVGLSISYKAHPLISSIRPRRIAESVNRDTLGTVTYSPRAAAIERLSYSSLANTADAAFGISRPGSTFGSVAFASSTTFGNAIFLSSS